MNLEHLSICEYTPDSGTAITTSTKAANYRYKDKTYLEIFNNTIFYS